MNWFGFRTVLWGRRRGRCLPLNLDLDVICFGGQDWEGHASLVLGLCGRFRARFRFGRVGK